MARYVYEIIKKREIQRIQKKIDDLIELIPSVERKLRDKYNKIVERDLKYMARSAVDIFYEKYPTEYDRYGDLYNAFKVTATDTEWSIEFSPEFMKHEHHQSNEIIYNNAFVLGYHGGSWGKSDYFGFRPPSGVPYYRGPGGESGWVYWTRPAVRTTSPLEMIRSMDPQGYINKKAQNMIIEFDDILQPYVSKIKRNLSKIL